jgi:hypothetical protein
VGTLLFLPYRTNKSIRAVRKIKLYKQTKPYFWRNQTKTLKAVQLFLYFFLHINAVVNNNNNIKCIIDYRRGLDW